MKDVMRIGKKGKLILIFIILFEILRRVGEVTYELYLPLGILAIHLIFHDLMEKKYYFNGSYIIHRDLMDLYQDLTF